MMLSVLALAGALSVIALPAEASSAFRYWSYWTTEPGATAWQYAAEGSGTRVPSDGAVEGWRFGIAGDDARIQPTLTPDFTSICAGIEAPADGKRVAVVIDTGSTAEAPEGENPGPPIIECITTSASSTGLQILQQVADVRMDAGFVCGIDGYPARECAPLVEIPTQGSNETSTTDSSAAQLSAASEGSPSSDSGTPLATAAVVSIAALVGFGLWRYRRRVRA